MFFHLTANDTRQTSLLALLTDSAPEGSATATVGGGNVLTVGDAAEVGCPFGDVHGSMPWCMVQILSGSKLIRCRKQIVSMAGLHIKRRDDLASGHGRQRFAAV